MRRGFAMSLRWSRSATRPACASLFGVVALSALACSDPSATRGASGPEREVVFGVTEVDDATTADDATAPIDDAIDDATVAAPDATNVATGNTFDARDPDAELPPGACG